MAGVSERLKQKEMTSCKTSNDHSFLLDRDGGFEVCTDCGIVGEAALGNVEHFLNEPTTEANELLGVKEEITEVLSKLHGGDTHFLADKVVEKIQRLRSDEHPLIRKFALKWRADNELDKALLAVLIHKTLLDQNCHEHLDIISYFSGADKKYVLEAGKILGIGRGVEHMYSSVCIDKIMEQEYFSQLPENWRRRVTKITCQLITMAFCELDALVCGVCSALCMEIKERMKMKLPGLDKKVDLVTMRKHVSKLRPSNVGVQFKVSLTAIKRVRAQIMSEKGDLIKENAEHMILFINNPIKRKVMFKETERKEKGAKKPRWQHENSSKSTVLPEGCGSGSDFLPDISQSRADGGKTISSGQSQSNGREDSESGETQCQPSRVELGSGCPQRGEHQGLDAQESRGSSSKDSEGCHKEKREEELGSSTSQEN